jgi:hypothetical protein
MKDHTCPTQLVSDCRMSVVAIKPDTRSWLYLNGMLCGQIKSLFKAKTSHMLRGLANQFCRIIRLCWCVSLPKLFKTKITLTIDDPNSAPPDNAHGTSQRIRL